MAKVDLPPDFRDLLESLNSAGVDYLVIGGYAVIYYGYKRATDDLDIWIAVNPTNAQKVSKVLQEAFGFKASAVKPRMFLEVGRLFIFGREPFRVDILTSPSGLGFAESYARRNVVSWDGLKVPLIDFQDLKRNKSASGRAKDLADLENLPSAPLRATARTRTKRNRR